MTQERLLLESLKKGNREAFNTLFKKYSPKLYFFCLKYFKGQIEAEEIVQDSFLKIWETHKGIDATCPFSTYLITIAKHRIFDQLRHEVVKRKYSSYLLHSSKGDFDLEHELIENNMKEHLWACVGHLPAQQKSILHLKGKGYGNSEIAERLHLSKRTVEKHINRALKYLQMHL